MNLKYGNKNWRFKRDEASYPSETIKVKRLHPAAKLPQKSKPGDIGYDLFILEEDRSKRIENSITNVSGSGSKHPNYGDQELSLITCFYRTGIAVKPPNGYYFEIVPRSGFSKEPFWQSNSIGIIEDEYTGELLVTVKSVQMRPEFSGFKQTQPMNHELVNGNRYFQLIPRLKLPNFDVEEVAELEKTDRGDNGFGSSGLS